MLNDIEKLPDDANELKGLVTLLASELKNRDLKIADLKHQLAGHKRLFGDKKAREVACMAHIRRKFVDVQQAQGSAIAEKAILRIAKLDEVEKEGRVLSPDERV